MQPAARLGDMHTCPLFNGPTPHVGGPILPPCAPTVLICDQPAARVTDQATCAGPPDIIVSGSATVQIVDLAAARMGDQTVHGGVIIMGCPTVLIGGGTVVQTIDPLVLILLNYQTPDDVMVTWEAPLWQGEARVTQTEAGLLDELSWLELRTMNNLRGEAFAAADAAYPMPSGYPGTRGEWRNLGHNDAFRHTYWNARMTQEFGEDWTRRFATAHEGVPGNEPYREAQDLYNNEQGRRIGAANPDASPEETAAAVQQAMDNGELIVVDDTGNIRFNNDVPPGDHYRPPAP